MSSPTVTEPTIAVPTVLVDMNLPKVRELAARLRFDPTRGRIWLDDRRMALLDAVSFSSLREELIASLGMEVARGLLTRIGYASGCRDAKLAMRDAPDDVLRVGAFLHALQGFVLPEHIRRHGLPYDEDYQSEWIWKDSLEDEGHVASHGIGPHPACWTGVGYTSGYLTTCSGRAILVRELECRAQGHAQCRSVARPVSQWTGAEEDMRYLEPQPLATRVFGGVQHARAAAPACDPTVPRPAARDDEPRLVGGSAAFHVLRHKLLRVAPTRATVLLLGESGVGKSLVAREVHRLSRRAQQPFVEINCAALPETLVEAELFGVERGAYSGATTSRPGRFEAAQGGTLFLDEIGTLSPTSQGKLLRVLQTGDFERLGSTRTLRTDVRVLAATNQDLKIAVREGRFRADLFFRLNVFPILIAPLRDRREDIPLLTEVLLARYAERNERRIAGITPAALNAILDHDWPGNIRELENVLERGVILANDGELIDLTHLQSADSGFRPAEWLGLSRSGALVESHGADSEALEGSTDVNEQIATRLLEDGPASLADLETALVRAAMNRARGNISRAAPLLGLTRAQMEHRVKKVRRDEG